jgi:hypothetical protein
MDLIDDVAAHAPYSAVVLAVKHREFAHEYPLEKLRALGGAQPPVLIDVKGFFRAADMERAGFTFWQL